MDATFQLVLVLLALLGTAMLGLLTAIAGWSLKELIKVRDGFLIMLGWRVEVDEWRGHVDTRLDRGSKAFRRAGLRDDDDTDKIVKSKSEGTLKRMGKEALKRGNKDNGHG